MTVVLLFLCSFSGHTGPADANVQMCVDHFPPRQIQTPDGHWTGYSVAVVQAIADRAKVSLTFTINTPFGRCLKYMKSGETQIMSGLRRTDERLEYMHMEPYSIASTSLLFSRTASELNISQPRQLAGLIVGVMRGFTYAKEFERMRDHIQLVEVGSLSAGFGMLNKGRIDVMMATDYYGYYQMQKEHSRGQFKVQPLSFTTDSPVYIGLSKAGLSDDISLRLQDATRALRKDGTIQAILQAHKPQVVSTSN
ncbi:hypothetical protein HMF8227_00918 [Saliniradius amylolyticus]|uniref:Solute-binding protein family 3/N-terminal domain-containing protein n=1 Tax=Saliniradius amylolyticus TaxID=2183582 RepID=A0A2S2E1A5_9ALTE|nr:transporter substrate-binding domain-containing protein [Saliniradius amylolyticus]AWL11413.1 hypothetical protein HMF8227_00918 [Saliniradius amylolyticus]